MSERIGSAASRDFSGVVKLTWYGSECNIDVGDDCIDEHLIDLEGKRVRVTVEVFAPCPKHGDGYVCQHEKGVDYADEWA